MQRWIKGWMLAGALVAATLATGCNDGGGDKYGDHDFGDNDPNKVVAIGDSITEGGECSDEGSSYPSRVAQMTGLSVVNSGNSGEKSGSTASRVGGVLDNSKPGFLLILTGHNDAIFDYSTESVINNIRSIINSAQSRKVIPIVATLVPIHSPRSWATDPAQDYSASIRQLAEEEDVPLVDLEEEFGEDESLQCDGLHPNAAGSAIIAAAFADELP